MVQVRDVLVRGRTSRLPGYNEGRYIPGGVAPRKAKATMNCRAPVVCLVTVPVSCLDTAAVPGGETPPGPSPRPPVVCSVTVPVMSCLDTAAVPGGETPPAPPSSTPGAGSQIYLLIFKKGNRAKKTIFTINQEFHILSRTGTPPKTSHSSIN